MRIGIAVGEVLEPATVEAMVEQVRAAAALGLDTAWSAQLSGLDALTALAVAGREVADIKLGTAAVPTYPRHPLALASQALTVQAATGNRLTLGIAPSHRVIIEGQFGYSFDQPARHVRDYITALAPLLRGESVTYAGETLRANGTVTVAGAEPPSLLLAALGPVLLRIAGELTDGTITANTGIKTIGDYIGPTLRRAATAAGRPEPRLVAMMMISVTAEPEQWRQWVGDQFGPGIDQLPSYRAMLDREGAAHPGEIAIVGDEAAVDRELRRLAEAGTTELIAIPFGSAEDRTRTTALLASLARSRPALVGLAR